MHWVTVFDLVQTGYRNWWAALVALGFMAVGLYFAFGRFRADEGNALIGCFRRPFGLLFAAFAVGWGFLAVNNSYNEYTDLRDSLVSGRANTVEGEIHNFQHLLKSERFDVRDVHFEYSDYDLIAGFHAESGDNGPIRNGVYVRIDYTKGEILRMKIREPKRTE